MFTYLLTKHAALQFNLLFFLLDAYQEGIQIVFLIFYESTENFLDWVLKFDVMKLILGEGLGEKGGER